MVVTKDEELRHFDGEQTFLKVYIDKEVYIEIYEEMPKFLYRELEGALMSTATMTRPDIAYAVRAVTRFYENPGLAPKQAVVMVSYSTQRNGERMEGKTVDSTWRRIRTRVLKLTWILEALCRVQS